jgi:hypothetical protein
VQERADASADAKPLSELAVQATTLRALPGAPSRLIEATAALHDLALAEGDEALASDLRDLQAALPADITVADDGPYLLTNAETLTDWQAFIEAARAIVAGEAASER